MKRLATLCLLLACAAAARAQISVPPRVSPYSAPGSIFPTDAGEGRMNSMISDPTAFTVGDFVTIVVNLSNTATQSRQLNTAKTAGINDTVTSLGNPNNTNLALQWAANQNFAGGGNQANTDALTTTVQARIDEVLPNGTFRVSAVRAMDIGKEKTTMVLSGFVRRQDLAADNSVSSNLVADLKVVQSGTGDISRSQRKGWLTTVYEFVNPF